MRKAFYATTDDRDGLLAIAMVLKINNALSENSKTWAQRILRARAFGEQMNVNTLNQHWIGKCCLPQDEQAAPIGTRDSDNAVPTKR